MCPYTQYLYELTWFIIGMVVADVILAFFVRKLKTNILACWKGSFINKCFPVHWIRYSPLPPSLSSSSSSSSSFFSRRCCSSLFALN